jgi:hypothetical protein
MLFHSSVTKLIMTNIILRHMIGAVSLDVIPDPQR